jgi:hypothetical protein
MLLTKSQARMHTIQLFFFFVEQMLHDCFFIAKCLWNRLFVTLRILIRRRNSAEIFLIGFHNWK